MKCACHISQSSMTLVLLTVTGMPWVSTKMSQTKIPCNLCTLCIGDMQLKLIQVQTSSEGEVCSNRAVGANCCLVTTALVIASFYLVFHVLSQLESSRKIAPCGILNTMSVFPSTTRLWRIVPQPAGIASTSTPAPWIRLDC